ncbi:ANTAR domain-containing protein [Amycolatopsis sp. NPDC023774]|uniref:ANTAR domain-containing protein n=1 Tax=Amycolatopsis sp. NPDC023774 TaxID=3155015 RepID=UPI0033D70819
MTAGPHREAGQPRSGVSARDVAMWRIFDLGLPLAGLVVALDGTLHAPSSLFVGRAQRDLLPDEYPNLHQRERRFDATTRRGKFEASLRGGVISGARGATMSMVESQPQQTAWSVSAPRHAAEDVDPSEVLAEENRQLQEALENRVVIEQAKGALMAQRRCSPQEAFGVLVTLSQDTNVKLRDVARAFLDEFRATLPAEPHGGPTASA